MLRGYELVNADIVRVKGKHFISVDGNIFIPIDLDLFLEIGLVTTWDTKVIGITTVVESNPAKRVLTVEDKATKNSVSLSFLQYQDMIRKASYRRRVMGL